MKTQTRLTTLIALIAHIGFMLGAVSCSTPGAQAKIDQASAKYESATGISASQTIGLVGKWWQDYQQARQINALLKTDVIRATKASPITSTKEVLDPRPLSMATPAAPKPAEPPRRVRRPDAHHRLQLASN